MLWVVFEMADKQNNIEIGRRKILQFTGAAITYLVGTGFGGAAQPDHAGNHGRPDYTRRRGPPEHANAPGWLGKKGNKVGLNVTESEYKSVSASDVRGVPDNARRVPFEVLQLQVQAINKELRANRLRFEDGSDGLSLKWTRKINPGNFEVEQ